MGKMTLDWNEYVKAARNVISEGCVLLENQGVLPLGQGTKVSVFGRIALDYYKSGTGSGGMVNVSKVYTIIDGLKESGVVELNEDLLKIYTDWEEENPFNEGMGWGTEPWSQEEMPLSDEVAKKASENSDIAIVVIGRTAGEDKDSSDTRGAYRLSEIEEDMLSKVRKNFDKVIVLLNIGQLMDLGFIDTYKPEGVMIVWQGGMIGGLGTADVLVGKVAPSGKLTDTAAFNIADYPSTDCFGDPNKAIYKEDIFVGYRYFETFARDKVRYPFGYGLSYTTFDFSDGSVKADINDKKLVVKSCIKNTGAVSGKQVMQVYISAPQGKLGKAARVLGGFAKTNILAPGESEELTVTVPFDLFASYDDKGVTAYPESFLLEAGEYKVYVGDNVRSAQLVNSFTLESDLLIEKLGEAFKPVEAYDRMVASGSGEELAVSYEPVALKTVDERERRLENIPEEIPVKSADISLTQVYTGEKTLDEFIASLSDEDLACIVRGEGMGSSLVTPGTASAFGGVSKSLIGKGIPSLCCDDGPSGMRLDSGMKAFSLPSGAMVASTFNPELISKMYAFTALEMINNNVDVLLGPGMNIHRHPLNGRNFEYFSEDPFVTGVMGSAMMKGLKSHGVSGCAKHFCANNQETGRHTVDSVVSERALREIYLKGFEIAVKDGYCDAIMTTYGQVNGVWTAGNYDLNTKILREEWGFKGVVMTDWWADVNERDEAPAKNNTAAMVAAQNDLYMVVASSENNTAKDNTIEALASGRIKRSELQRCAKNICEFALASVAIKKGTSEEVSIEIINRPTDEDEFDMNNVEYLTLDGEITVSLKDKPSVAGTNYYIPLDIVKLGFYEITLTGSSNLGSLAQIPCTLYYTGVPFLTYTFNGSEGKAVSITKGMAFHNRMAVFRLNVAKNGVDLDSISFKYLKPLDKKYATEE